MGELQRSCKMTYLQVAVPTAASEDFAHQLGKMSCMMITDLNSHVQSIDKKYMKDIIRLQEATKTVQEIERLLTEEGITVTSEFNETDLKASKRNVRIENVEAEVQEDYVKMTEQLQILNELRSQLTMRNNHIATAKAQKEFHQQARGFGGDGGGTYQDGADDEDVSFKWISGVLSEAQLHAFRRQVYLISRGNCYTLFKEIPDTEDVVYIAYYLGDRLDVQIKKLCDYMDIGIIMQSNEKARPQDELIAELKANNEQTKTVIDSTQRKLDVDMRTINERLKRWKSSIIMELSIRVLLNKFQESSGDGTSVCHGWCPEKDVDKVKEALELACKGKGVGNGVGPDRIQPPKGAVYPTHFETNKFTATFQGIIDTYGIPRYREYNPTPPSIITFPFLFAMMYGDVFHGSCIFITATWLIYNEKKLGASKRNELLDWLYCGRYLLILMGTFSVYNGFIYNEVISLSFSLFGSTAWSENTSTDFWTVEGVYPFGVDPVWHGREEQIEFTNSIKMKLSVIYGVGQMTFGLILAMLNHIEYRDWVTLIFEWIPQLLFMLSFFVYMIFMIIYKWCINWQEKDYSPPSLITALVNMVLSAGAVEKDETQLFDNAELQYHIQFAGMLIMLGSIPVMLLAKPIINWCLHKQKMKKEGYNELEHDSAPQQSEFLESDEKDGGHTGGATEHGGGGGGHGHGHDDEEFEFGEEFIHQMIHTIEYVLGTISNTASYLRLWALSLAHSQLSEVFYEKTLLDTMKANGYELFVGTTLFYGVTFGVLLVMDQLECFLHALRLHWVEFQNKFYNADGIAFVPFSYAIICNPKEY